LSESLQDPEEDLLDLTLLATQSIVTGDLDRDGDLDLIAGNASPDEPLILYINSGPAPLPEKNRFTFRIFRVEVSTPFVATLDPDGDGDQDLWLGGSMGRSTQIWLNQ